MKKVLMPVAAVAATLALGDLAMGGGPGDQGDQQTKIDTAVTLSFQGDPYDPNDPYNESGTFSGTVTASGGDAIQHQKCERRRTVLIKNAASRDVVGYDTTNASGQFSTAVGPYIEAGDYFAKALKKRKVRAEIKCRGGRSGNVTVPNGGGGGT